MLSNTIWPAAEHERIFSRDAVDHLIDGAVYSSEIEWTKPHPEAFRAALAAVGVAEPARAVFVGDRLFEDIYGANQVGMRAVLIPHSVIPPQQLGTDGTPDAIIEELGRPAGDHRRLAIGRAGRRAAIAPASQAGKRHRRGVRVQQRPPVGGLGGGGTQPGQRLLPDGCRIEAARICRRWPHRCWPAGSDNRRRTPLPASVAQPCADGLVGHRRRRLVAGLGRRRLDQPADQLLGQRVPDQPVRGLRRPGPRRPEQDRPASPRSPDSRTPRHVHIPAPAAAPR